MPWSEMVVMIALFSALVLGGIHLLRLFGTMILHRTIRKAIDRDPAAAEPLLERLSAPAPVTERGDDRTATLLIAFGVAMVVASLVIGDSNWIRYPIAGAVFPLIIGVALWLRHYALNRSRRTDSAEQQ
jgi:membrane associated rhomboid family serine protease